MRISIFKSVGQAWVSDVYDLTWPEMADLLCQHDSQVQSKSAGLLYNLAEFKDSLDPETQPGRRYHGSVVEGQWQRDIAGTYDTVPGTTRRCRENLVGTWALVLDVDSNQTIAQAQQQLVGLEYVLYTTFRHTPEQHKFRVVLPFKTRLLAADIAGYQQSIMLTFPGVDPASFTISQSFYFHSGLTDPQSLHNKGRMLDPYQDFEYQEPEVWRAPAVTAESTTEFTEQQQLQYRQRVMACLRTCSGLHYAGADGSQLGILALVSICKSIGATYDEYDLLVQQISAADSQLASSAVRRQAWTGWTGNRARAQLRDRFLSDYRGLPYQHHQLALTTQELKKRGLQ